MPRPEILWFVEQRPFPGGKWHVYRQFRRAAPVKIGGEYETKEQAKSAMESLQKERAKSAMESLQKQGYRP